MAYAEIRCGTEDLEAFAQTPQVPAPVLPQHINLEPDRVERGLTQLVLSVVELVRRLLEKQALRRIEGGSLSDDQVEKLGTTLMRLEEQMEGLRKHFGIESLNLDLGPLGNLFDESNH